MGDFLRSKLFTSTLATPKELAETPVTDNHGNSFSRNSLSCSGNLPVALSFNESLTLKTEIWVNALPNALGAADEEKVEVLGGLESPLKAKCDELRSEDRKAGSVQGRPK